MVAINTSKVAASGSTHPSTSLNDFGSTLDGSANNFLYITTCGPTPNIKYCNITVHHPKSTALDVLEITELDKHVSYTNNVGSWGMTVPLRLPPSNVHLASPGKASFQLKAVTARTLYGSHPSPTGSLDTYACHESPWQSTELLSLKSCLSCHRLARIHETRKVSVVKVHGSAFSSTWIASPVRLGEVRTALRNVAKHTLGTMNRIGLKGENPKRPRFDVAVVLSIRARRFISLPLKQFGQAPIFAF